MQIKAAHNRNIDIACVQSLKGFVCDTMDNAAKQKLNFQRRQGAVYICHKGDRREGRIRQANRSHASRVYNPDSETHASCA
jgi:hypothetical protein